MSKKLFTSFIAFAMVVTMVVPSLPAQATTIVNGDLVTATTSCKGFSADAVYLVEGSSLKVFPYLSVYLSHGFPSDFSTVKTVTCADLDSYTVAGYAKFRDGVAFRGTTMTVSGEYEARTVYMVEGGKIKPIVSCSVYNALFNDTTCVAYTYWVPDVFVDTVNYEHGDMINSADVLPTGMFVKVDATTYGVTGPGNTVRQFSSDDAIAANRYHKNKAINATVALTEGTPITGAESGLLAVGVQTITVMPGTLSVVLSSDTPASANVPILAQNVAYTKFRIVNGNQNSTVTALTVKRTGLGAAGDFATVGLFEGDVQISTYRTLSSSTDSANFNFPTPLVLGPGQVKEYTIKASLTGLVAGRVNRLGVSAVTGATASGLPVYGNPMSAVDITIGSVAVTSGSLSNTTPKIGEDNVELATVRLQPDSTEDVHLYSFKLRQTGTARASDLANLAVYQSGVKVGDCVMANDYLNCILYQPFEIKKSQLREFKVLGDIEDGYNRTVIFAREEIYDINAVGKSYGFPVTVTGTFTAQDATIAAGAVTINFSGPNASDIARSQQDIVLANFEITSNNEDAEIRTFLVDIKADGSATTSTSLVENVELYDVSTGGIYDGSIVGNQFRFSPYTTLVKGVKHTFQIRFDTPYGVSVADGTYYSVDLAASDMTVRGSASNQDLSPSPSTLTGRSMTLKAPALTVTPTTLVNQTIVGGQKGVPLYRGVLTAAGETIKVTQMVFTDHTADYFKDDNVDHVYLYKVNGTTHTLIKELTDAQFGGTTATFSGLNLEIPAGSANAVTFMVSVDVANNASGHLGIKINAAGDVVAETLKEGTNVNPSGTYTGNGRTVTLAAKGTLAADMDVASGDVSRDLYRVANTTTGWLGRIKLTAANEDVRITTITLGNATATTGATEPSKSVNWLKLYKADKTTEVATAFWNEGASEITFEGLDHVVGVGIDYLFIKANLNKIGTGPLDTARSFDEIRLRVKAATGVVAYGYHTGLAITNGSGLTIGTTYTKSSVVAAADLVGIVNNMADGGLGSGSRIIGRFEVSAGATDNLNSSGTVADLLLKQLKITFSGNVTASSATIERVGGIDSAASISAGANVVGTTATINIAGGLTNDHKIEPATKAVYLIRATVEYTGSGTKWIQTKINGLNTGSAVIIWDDGHSSDFEVARLPYDYVDGAYLSIQN